MDAESISELITEGQHPVKPPTEDRICHHSGTITWNPWTRSVECIGCKEVFYYADPTNHGQILQPVWPADDEENLALQLFKSVRSTGEMTEVEKPLFIKMAKVALAFCTHKPYDAPET